MTVCLFFRPHGYNRPLTTSLKVCLVSLDTFFVTYVAFKCIPSDGQALMGQISVETATTRATIKPIFTSLRKIMMKKEIPEPSIRPALVMAGQSVSPRLTSH